MVKQSTKVDYGFRTAVQMSGVSFVFALIGVGIAVFNLYNISTMYDKGEVPSAEFKAYDILLWLTLVCGFMALSLIMSIFSVANSRKSDIVVSFIVVLFGFIFSVIGAAAIMYLFNTNILSQ